MAAIAFDSDSGRALAEEARALLHLIGKPDAQTISLTDLQQRAEVLSAKGFNGDGAVPEAAQLISHVLITVGGVADSNGQLGVNKSHAQTFFDEAAALREWRAKADGDSALTPLGMKSIEAADAVLAVRTCQGRRLLSVLRHRGVRRRRKKQAASVSGRSASCMRARRA